MRKSIDVTSFLMCEKMLEQSTFTTVSDSEYSSSLEDSDDDDESYDSSSGTDSSDSSVESVTATDKRMGLNLSLGAIETLRRSCSEGNLLGAFLDGLPTPPQQQQQQKVRPQQHTRRHSGGQPTGSRLIFHAIQTKSAQESHAHLAKLDANVPKPKETLQAILTEHNVPYKLHRAVDLEKAFFTKGCVHSHSFELMAAIRQNNVDAVVQYSQQGHNLQTCNKFGESIVHAAARRGCHEILTYMSEHVSLRVCCQQGRTPLHDGCWTGVPSFKSIGVLLADCPDLLYIQDNRGFVPLDYVPKEAHAEWNDYLRTHEDLVLPRILLDRNDDSS